MALANFTNRPITQQILKDFVRERKNSCLIKRPLGTVSSKLVPKKDVVRIS